MGTGRVFAGWSRPDRLPIKDGSETLRTFTRPDGTSFAKSVYPNTLRVPSSEVTHVFVTLGWTGHQWILINLYPVKVPKPTTKIGLDKIQKNGNSVI